MKTPVYLNNDAHDQLLLSEGVCRQLGIITYHHLAEPWRGSKKADTCKSKDHAVTDAKVPRVVVNLVRHCTYRRTRVLWYQSKSLSAHR